MPDYTDELRCALQWWGYPGNVLHGQRLTPVEAVDVRWGDTLRRLGESADHLPVAQRLFARMALLVEA